ncbi:MAG: IclR family transcriptional regulator, partial [Actinomycetota bacterium]
ATIVQLDARYVVTIKNWVGRRTPLHCTSDGKVLLAFGNGRFPPGPLQRLGERTIRSKAELARELDDIRARGWASALGELEDGLHGVAAPVLDGSGRCLAALGVSGPSYRLPPEALSALAEECALAAKKIGTRIVAVNNGV